MHCRVLHLLIASAALTTAAAPAPDPLATRLIADARTVDEASFGFVRTERREDGKTVEMVVDRYDPSSQPRWRLVSVDGKAPTTEALTAYTKAIGEKPTPNYGRVALLLAHARRLDSTHFRVDRLPKGFLTGRGSQYSNRLVADLTVNSSGAKPFISEQKVYLPKPFKVYFVASVERFDGVTRYQAGPDGRPRVMTQDVTLKVSQPVGTISNVSHATFSPL